MYVYELGDRLVQTFVDLTELIMAATSHGDDEDEDEADSSFGATTRKIDRCRQKPVRIGRAVDSAGSSAMSITN